MNNIVFIGPYRQYNYAGITSNMFLYSIHQALIKKSIKTYSRPLYLDMTVIQHNHDPIANDKYKVYENMDSDIKECLAVVQHAPIEYLAVQKKWKNIAIPILDPKIYKASKYNQIQHLNGFDRIIVSSEQEKNTLFKSGINKPIDVCDENLISHTTEDIRQKRYDFGAIHNESYNFGFIGPYLDNISIIHKAILSFIIAFRTEPQYQLYLFLRGTQQDKTDIEKFYRDTLKQLKIYHHTSIKFIFSPLDLEASIAALNSIDCLLSINDDVGCYLYENYIKKLNKNLISRANTELIQVPATVIDHRYDIDDILGSISTTDFINKLQQTPVTTKPNRNKTSNLSTVGEAICRALT